MAVDEVRLRLREKLEAAVGAEEASVLLDRPPGGWNDLVTQQVLTRELDLVRSEIAALRSELRGEMAEFRGEMRAEMSTLSASVDRRLRAQTWIMTTTLIASLTISSALSTAIASAIVR